MKAKETKEVQSPKVNPRPDVVKSSEHVTLADAQAVNKELKAATLNPEKRKVLVFFITKIAIKK